MHRFLLAILLCLPLSGFSTSYTLSRSQTAYLLEHPELLAYIEQLHQGLTPAQIKERFALTSASERQYLSELRRLKVVNEDNRLVWEGQAWNWHNGDEAFEAFTRKRLQHELAARILEGGDSCHQRLGGFRLSTQQTQSFYEELNQVRQKYHAISTENRRQQREDLAPVLFQLAVIYDWRPPLLSDVRNLP